MNISRKSNVLHLAVLVLGLLAAPAVSQQADAGVEEAQAIVKDLRLQTDLPKTEKTQRPRNTRKISIPTWIAYLVIGLFAALVAAAVAREMNRRGLTMSRSRSGTGPEANVAKIREAHSTGNIAEYIRQLLSELASSTDFADAVHRMLLEAITIIKPSLDFHLSDAFTSREIIDRLELTPDREKHLAVIIDEVERSHFGGLDVTRAQFEACLEAFRALVLPRGAAANG